MINDLTTQFFHINKNLYQNNRIKYFFADDDTAKKYKLWINNSSTRNSIKKNSILARMVRDYKNKYLQTTAFDTGIFSITPDNPEFYDFFAHVNIACDAAKSFNRIKRKESFSHRDDLIILKNFVLESNNLFRSVLISFKEECELNFFHPYVKAVLGENSSLEFKEYHLAESFIFDLLSSDDYKRDESLFIRSSNDQSNRIKNFFVRQFNSNKRIYVCRYDVIFDFSSGFRNLSIDNYRKCLSEFLRSLPFFNSALEVTFPSVLLSGSVRESTSPVGQILLFANKKVSSNLSDLKSFSQKEMIRGPLRFIPAQGIIGEANRKISIDGELSLSPFLIKDVSLLSDFLTIERRYCAPRKIINDQNKSFHNFREIIIDN